MAHSLNRNLIAYCFAVGCCLTALPSCEEKRPANTPEEAWQRFVLAIVDGAEPTSLQKIHVSDTVSDWKKVAEYLRERKDDYRQAQITRALQRGSDEALLCIRLGGREVKVPFVRKANAGWLVVDADGRGPCQ
jgi:hypothetical protein